MLVKTECAVFYYYLQVLCGSVCNFQLYFKINFKGKMVGLEKTQGCMMNHTASAALNEAK